MNHEHEEFLQKICDEVDKLTEQYLPANLSPEDVQINVRLITGKNSLGDHIRLLGNAIFVRLDSIKFDTSSLHPGQRSLHRSDKFLGMDIIWVNIEHISSLYPGKTIEIEGYQTKTCYISIMEENMYRVSGTCEEFFEDIHTPLVQYYADTQTPPSQDDNSKVEEEAEEEGKAQERSEDDSLLQNM